MSAQHYRHYWISEQPLPGVAVLLSGWPRINEPIGYVVSIYGGFAPTPWGDLKHGFTSKKKLASYCQQNGFAIYYAKPAGNATI